MCLMRNGRNPGKNIIDSTVLTQNSVVFFMNNHFLIIWFMPLHLNAYFDNFVPFYNTTPDSHMTINDGNISNYTLKMTVGCDLC